MAFYNLNVVQTPVPTYYTYILQTVPNPSVQTSQVTDHKHPQYAAPIDNNNDDTPPIKEECQSEDELEDKSNLNVELKLETQELTIKKEECEEIEINSTKKFKCPHCVYTTHWKGNLNKHVISRHTSSEKIKWLQCDLCDYKGKTRDYLKCHLVHVHNISVKWYNCDLCDFKAKVKAHLERHIIIHHRNSDQIEWLQCHYCSYKAKFKRSLREHVLSCHTETTEIQWFNCEYCAFKAKRKRNLQFHVLNKHTAEHEIKWFHCGFCSNKFKRKQTLQVHIDYVHDGDGNKKDKVRTKEIPVFIENKLCWRRVVVDDGSPESSSEQGLRCEECRLTFEDRELFKKHMMKCHTVTEIQRKDDQLVKKTFKTKYVVALVDDVPVVKKVIDVPLSCND